MGLKFSTPSAWQEGVLGATFGFAGAPDPAANTEKEFPISLQGTLITGTYDQCLAGVVPGHYDAGLVLFGNCGGEEAFLQKLQKKAGCPLTGGAAAIDPVTGRKGLVMGQQQAAVYLISDERYTFSVECKNIHENILQECKVEFDDPRVVKSINREDPVAWYNRQRDALGLSHSDFEHLTLSDLSGVNAHLSVADGKLVSGRNLEETMLLRFVEPSRVYPQMQAFYKDNGIVCGCAGLKGILPQSLDDCPMGLFLFGEVCTVDGVGKFGNLMLSKLCIKEK